MREMVFHLKQNLLSTNFMAGVVLEAENKKPFLKVSVCLPGTKILLREVAV